MKLKCSCKTVIQLCLVHRESLSRAVAKFYCKNRGGKFGFVRSQTQQTRCYINFQGYRWIWKLESNDVFAVQIGILDFDGLCMCCHVTIGGYDELVVATGPTEYRPCLESFAVYYQSHFFLNRMIAHSASSKILNYKITIIIIKLLIPGIC